ncbi:unnamed protein product [Heligmosomoides polygyrus]|uniref:Fibronectin type-III domain-containing protein n=1 Tax=Heligmosomoides polygyrus TaxID=6339 RepID=A0A183FGX0_HELPZ|nr:unnamed protein product [Heligmosomoides polygyrus]
MISSSIVSAEAEELRTIDCSRNSEAPKCVGRPAFSWDTEQRFRVNWVTKDDEGGSVDCWRLTRADDSGTREELRKTKSSCNGSAHIILRTD